MMARSIGTLHKFMIGAMAVALAKALAGIGQSAVYGDMTVKTSVSVGHAAIQTVSTWSMRGFMAMRSDLRIRLKGIAPSTFGRWQMSGKEFCDTFKLGRMDCMTMPLNNLQFYRELRFD